MIINFFKKDIITFDSRASAHKVRRQTPSKQRKAFWVVVFQLNLMIGFKPQNGQIFESPNCPHFNVGILYLHEPLKRSCDDSLARYMKK